MWGLPAFVVQHGNLRGAQGCRWTQSILQHRRVEATHDLGSGAIVDAPKTRHHARRTRVHEAACQSHQSFAFNLFTEGSLARAQHHQVSVEFQIVDVVKTQKTILRPSLFVD